MQKQRAIVPAVCRLLTGAVLALALLLVEAAAASELLHRSVCAHHHDAAPDAEEDAPCAVKIFQGGGWEASFDAPPVLSPSASVLLLPVRADAPASCVASRLPAGRGPPALR